MMGGIQGSNFAAAYSLPVIVTISNEYGSGAVAVAARVAELLGYELVDRQLPVVVAKRLHISPEDVEVSEDMARTVGERLLEGLELSTPELAESSTEEPFDETLLRAVQVAVREYAAHGNVVIVGRGAGAILGPRPDVLRVFMHAPRDWRVDHIVNAMHVDAATARREIDRVDRARAAYLKDWYEIRFGDPLHNDLAVDTSTFGEEGSAALIVAAVSARS
jgi:cytidylate kinase